MRPIALAFACIALPAAAGMSWFLGMKASEWVETETEAILGAALDAAELPWASAEADGLKVTLMGTAPSERARFRAVEAVIAHVSSSRLRDEITINTDQAPPVPDLALQILRADETTTLAGTATEGRAYERFLTGIAQRGTVPPPETGMVELLDTDEPEGWADSLALASRAANLLSDAQIALTPGTLSISATVESGEERDRIVDLLQATPGYDALNVELLLSAPMQTIAPFRFHLDVSEARSRVRECAATSAIGQQAIIAALAGRAGNITCPAAIGAPTEDWTAVVEAGIAALNTLNAGTLDVVNTDVALVSAIGGDRALFEAEAERLRAALPAPYTLEATYREALPEGVENAAAPPARFAAIRRDDGAVEMQGDLRDRNMQRTAASYASAQFGFDAVVDETALRGDLPVLWYTHILAGLEALSLLNTGQVEVFADRVLVKGEVQNERFIEEIRGVIGRKLPGGTDVALDITVNPVLKKPAVSSQRAELCEAQIGTILARAQITFPPGETEITEESQPIVEGIARILEECPGARFEIAGYTDSQGRESSNLAISQARAVAVLNALIDLEVRQVFLVARGFGEEDPIADNQTEEGRAANRRIEFRVIRRDGEAAPETAATPEAQPDAPTEANEDAASDDNPPEAPEDAEATDATPAVEPDAEGGGPASGDEAPEEPATADGADDDAADEAPASGETMTSGSEQETPRRTTPLPQIGEPSSEDEEPATEIVPTASENAPATPEPEVADAPPPDVEDEETAPATTPESDEEDLAPTENAIEASPRPLPRSPAAAETSEEEN